MPRRYELVLVWLVGDAGDGEPSDVANDRIEVDPVRRDRKVLTLHGERPQPATQGGLAHERVVSRTPRVEGRLEDRQVRAAVLDDPSADPWEVRLAGRPPRVLVPHDRVIMEVGYGASSL